MKKLLLFTILFGVFITAARAQSVTAKDLDDIDARSDIAEYFQSDLFMYQLAADARSAATINTVGSYNETTIAQSGSGNVGIILTRGDHNRTTLTQTGTNLSSLIGIEGDLNKLIVDQIGQEVANRILLQGTGLKFNVYQIGIGTTITQLGSSIPIIIHKSGSPIAIKISNN